MVRSTLFLALMMLSLPAMAQPAKVEAEKLAPPSPASRVAPAPAKEEAEPVTPEEQALLLCQTQGLMAETNSQPVAGPDYQPGVDAYGKAVTPADGQAQPVYQVPERIDIPLNIDVLKTVGVITTPTPGLSTNVGTVSILKGGQVLFNGQDAGSAVQTYCNTHMTKQQKAQ